MKSILIIFLFIHTATTEIYTLSLHDALPICRPWTKFTRESGRAVRFHKEATREEVMRVATYTEAEYVRGIGSRDRKSTRLNSSHLGISYAVFCLKKKKSKKNAVLESYTMSTS